MSEHAKFSPSAGERWMNCPAYIKLVGQSKKLFGDLPVNEAAQEGTEVHELAAKVLSARNPVREVERIECDDETRECLRLYVNTIEDYLDTVENIKDCEIGVERKLRYDHNLFGTADYIAVSRKTVYDKHSKEDKYDILIVDYKHGKRTYSDSDGWQTRIYAWMALQDATRAGKEIDKITLCIVQPRYIGDAEPVRYTTYDAKEFLEKYDVDITTEIMGLRGMSPRNLVSASTGGHCKFCDAKAICPAAKVTIMTILEFSDEDLKDINNVKYILDNEERIRSVLNNARSLAISGLEKGMVTTDQIGYGLKKGKGNRKWDHPKGEEGLAPLLRRHGVDKDVVWTRKLISPAQAEKLVDDKAWLDKYTTRPEGKISLVKPDKADPELMGSVTKQLGEFQEAQPAEEISEDEF